MKRTLLSYIILAATLFFTLPTALSAQDADPAPLPAAPEPAAQLPPAHPTVATVPPLSAGGKLKYALRHGFGPNAMLSAFAVAGYQQALDLNKGFGQGAEGYFSRVGSDYGKTATRHFIGSFALASIFHQDPRYIHSDKSGFFPRATYAASRVLVGRGDNGNRQFNISALGGIFASSFISNYWHQPPDDTNSKALRRAAFGIGTHALRDIVREFWPDIRARFKRHP